MRRARSWLLALGAASGCYQAQSLDARDVLRAIEREEREAPASAARAPAAPALGRDPSEDEAVDLALRYNPELRAQRRQRGIAEGQVISAVTLQNPTLDIELLHLEDYGTRNAWALELGWEPPQPGIFLARRAAAHAQLDAVKAEIVEAERQLAANVRAAHAEVRALAEKLALLDEALEVRRKLAATVERRVAGGASTRIDLSLAQLALTEREQERDQLEASAVAARALLGQLLGVTRPVGAAGRLPDESGPPEALDVLVETALAQRPALVAGELRFRQREENLRLEHARAWPWFRFTAAPRYRADGSDSHPNDFVLGLQVTLPIFDQNRGPIRVAAAERDQERERLRRLVVDVRRGLAAARDQVLVHQRTLRRYREGVLPQLDGHEKLLALATEGGQTDLVALLAAADVILRSRSEWVDARLAHYRAWIELERAVGARLQPGAKP